MHVASTIKTDIQTAPPLNNDSAGAHWAAICGMRYIGRGGGRLIDAWVVAFAFKARRVAPCESQCR